MYCIIKCIVQGKQARVKNADLRHPSCTVVMQKRKCASPVLNVLTLNVSSVGPTVFSIIFITKNYYFFRYYTEIPVPKITTFCSL